MSDTFPFLLEAKERAREEERKKEVSPKVWRATPAHP